MNTSFSPLHTHALVLGGGGSTGNAWLIGVIAGLHEGGLDVTTSDLTIGTSAGSTAAAQIAGATPFDLLAAAVNPPTRAQTAPPTNRPAAPGRRAINHLQRTAQIIAASADLIDMRRRMGASAVELDAASDGSWSAQWRSTVAARLGAPEWPKRALLITAVDAHTGEPVVFDRHSGVELVDAVAASCAGGPPYRIGDSLYIDGGYRTNAENADLAAGSARVLVLSPFGGRSRTPVEWGTHLADQVDGLREGGSQVEMIVPPTDSEHLFGAHAMDLSLRPAAAMLGHDQGVTAASRLAEFWG